MSNKALWQRAFVTDPKAVKPITGKQYSGNSPKPYWIVERLTDEFGPCGIGWGFSIVNERFERFSDTDTLHVAVISFWYVLDGKRGELQQVGQTKASYTTSKGSFMLDEDAPKKSVTDALVKCASYLGFAGDIFSGMWDDSKYVAWANNEWREREKAPEQRQEDEKRENRGHELETLAGDMVAVYEEGQELAAVRMWNSAESWSADLGECNEEKKYVWSLLKEHSKLRSLLKANKPEQVAA